jgi:hypothetical protein
MGSSILLPMRIAAKKYMVCITMDHQEMSRQSITRIKLIYLAKRL